MRIAQSLTRQRSDHLAKAHVAFRERRSVALRAQEDRADHGPLRLDRHDDDRADVAQVELTLHVPHHGVNRSVGNEHRLARFKCALQLRIAIQVDDEIPDRRIFVAGNQPYFGVVAGEKDGGTVETEGLAKLSRNGLQNVDEMQRRADFLKDVDGGDQMVAFTLKLGYPRFQSGYFRRRPRRLLALRVLGEHDPPEWPLRTWCAP